MDLLGLVAEELCFHDKLLFVLLASFDIEKLGLLFWLQVVELAHVLVVLKLVVLLLLLLLVEEDILILVLPDFHADE